MELHEIIARIDMSGGPGACWPYMGARLKQETDYGVAPYGRHPTGKWKMWRVHRLMYVVAYGPLAPDVLVLHTCDNYPCCNWMSHLYAGTHRDNTRDALERGRHRTGATGKQFWKQRRHTARGEEIPTAKLTAGQIAAIRAVPGYWGVNAALAMQYGVAAQHIGRIRRGLAWKPEGGSC